MKPRSDNARASLLIVLLAALFSYGVVRAFSIRFATGDVYPDYSSLKAAPDGAKLLYDSLSRIPGLTVSRNFSPLEYADATDAAVLLLAVDPNALGGSPERYIVPIERLASRGNRVVAALDWNNNEKLELTETLDKLWKVKIGLDKERKRLYFTDAEGWRVIQRDGPEILAIERDVPKGSIALFAGSADFGNEAVVRMDVLGLVSAALGSKNRVIFDEQHFGITESGSVVGLARRFRLSGMAIGLAMCAALFIWKNGAGFPPPGEPPRREILSGRTSLSGLYTLLRRHIKPADLASTCWKEWLIGNGRDVSPERRARAEAILRQYGDRPLDAAREIQSVLHAKGPF